MGAGRRTGRAGVSSFGLSGTNAHVILEEAPREPESPTATVSTPAPELPVLPIVVSARAPRRSPPRPRASARTWSHPQLELRDLAATLGLHRARFSERAVVLAEGREQLLSGLGALADGGPAANLIRATAVNDGKIGVPVHRAGKSMGRHGQGAASCLSRLRRGSDSVCAELDPLLGRSLEELLFASEGSPEAELLDRTQFTQAAIFAIEVALFRLVSSFGIEPDYLIGHSIGEIWPSTWRACCR